MSIHFLTLNQMSNIKFSVVLTGKTSTFRINRFMRGIVHRVLLNLNLSHSKLKEIERIILKII